MREPLHLPQGQTSVHVSEVSEVPPESPAESDDSRKFQPTPQDHLKSSAESHVDTRCFVEEPPRKGSAMAAVLIKLAPAKAINVFFIIYSWLLLCVMAKWYVDIDLMATNCYKRRECNKKVS